VCNVFAITFFHCSHIHLGVFLFKVKWIQAKRSLTEYYGFSGKHVNTVTNKGDSSILKLETIVQILLLPVQIFLWWSFYYLWCKQLSIIIV
jgi:hypothetical protein